MFQETLQHDLAQRPVFVINESLATGRSISSLTSSDSIGNSFSEVLQDEVRATRAQSYSIM